MEFEEAQGEEPRGLPGGGVDASWGLHLVFYQVTMKPKAFTCGKNKGQRSDESGQLPTLLTLPPPG